MHLTLTEWIIVATVVILLLVDLWLYKKKGDDATISRTTLMLAQQWPVVPLLFGVLMGHLFWTNCGTDCPSAQVKSGEISVR